MFSCNLPPAILAEWPGYFTCYCGTVTRGWNEYQNKSQHRKSTLEKKILPRLLQGFEPATFQSRVRRSNHWAIPAPLKRSLDILLPSRTSSTHLLPPTLYHVIWRLPSSNLYWKSHHLTKIFWKTIVPFLTFHFCPKSLKRSFSTNFSPISKKTTSAVPFSQPIEQDTALRPFCYVLSLLLPVSLVISVYNSKIWTKAGWSYF